MFTGDIFKTDAIDRANWNAQLAARAVRLYDRVHHLIAAEDGVGWASCDAQRTAYAPLFVNNGNRTRPLDAVDRIQHQSRAPGDGGQQDYASGAAGWALIDLSGIGCHCAGIGGAIRVAATCALSLR